MTVRGRVLQLALRAAGPSKGAPAAKKKRGEAVVVPVVAKELREKATLGANILKTGTDPPVLEDSAYPSWVFSLLDKSAALSELERRDPESLEEKEEVPVEFVQHGKADQLAISKELAEMGVDRRGRMY